MMPCDDIRPRPRIEAAWVVHLNLALAELYADIIAGVFFAQTWLLFPTDLARAAPIYGKALTPKLCQMAMRLKIGNSVEPVSTTRRPKGASLEISWI